MPINYNVQVTGVLPEDSLSALQDSFNISSKMSNYQKYHDEIEAFFLSEVQENMRHQGIDDDGISDGLSINIKDNKIEFRANNPNLINAIEYGSAHLPGQRFMQPAVRSVGNFMSGKILNEATHLYSKNTPIRSRTENTSSLPLIKSNKYGFMLK